MRQRYIYKTSFFKWIGKEAKEGGGEQICEDAGVRNMIATLRIGRRSGVKQSRLGGKDGAVRGWCSPCSFLDADAQPHGACCS